MSQTLLKRLEACARLPTPPGAVVQLLELTRQPEVSVREIADTIGLDPGLSMKLLRFANSPMAGSVREITSLQHAVSLMGINGVKMMALSFALLSSDQAKGCERFDQRQFTLQSLSCGVAAQVLAYRRVDVVPVHDDRWSRPSGRLLGHHEDDLDPKVPVPFQVHQFPRVDLLVERLGDVHLG